MSCGFEIRSLKFVYQNVFFVAKMFKFVYQNILDKTNLGTI